MHFFQSVFSKIMLLVVVIVLSIFLFGIFVFTRSESTITRQYTDYVEKQISAYLDVLEEQLEDLNVLQTQFLSDDDLQLLVLSREGDFDYNISSAVNRILDRMQNLKDMNEYIEEIKIIIPSMNRQFLVNESVAYEAITIDDNYNKILMDGIVNREITYYQNELYLLTKPINWDYRRAINGYLIITKLSKNKILEKIRGYDLTKDSISALYIEHVNTVLTDRLDIFDDDFMINHEKKFGTTSIAADEYLYIGYDWNIMNGRYYQLIKTEDAFSSVQMFKKWYLIYSLLLIFVVFVFWFYIHKMVKNPIDRLINAFENLEKGDFNYVIEFKRKDEFSKVFHSFNEMVKKLEKLLYEVYVQKILQQKSELRQLQAQINPHFLYNTFYLLKRRIRKKDHESAEAFCDMIGKYFQYIAKNDSDYATLEEEVNHARIYADFQSIRFKDRITVVFKELPDKYKPIIIPKLILQPIIENSFKYGLEDKEFDGILKVEFVDRIGFIEIIIEDNGEKFYDLGMMNEMLENVETIKETSGLMNIHKRLKLFKEGKSRLVFGKSSLGGLKVVVIIDISCEVN